MRRSGKKISDVEGLPYSPIFCEPYVKECCPIRQYSAIGPWDGEIIIGLGENFRVPYFTSSFSSSHYVKELKRYKDVSSQLIKVQNGFRFGTCVCLKEDCFCSKVFSPWVRHENVFFSWGSGVKWKKRKRSAYVPGDKWDRADYKDCRAYVMRDDGEVFFNFVKAKIYGSPSDGKNSLIYPLKFFSLLYAIRNKSMHEVLACSINPYGDEVDIKVKPLGKIDCLKDGLDYMYSQSVERVLIHYYSERIVEYCNNHSIEIRLDSTFMVLSGLRCDLDDMKRHFHDIEWMK